MKKSESSISSVKIRKQKGLFIEQLKRNPNVQIACEKLEVGRSSFYRWQSEDPSFKKEVDEAVSEGVTVVNDLAESKLVLAVKDGDIQAIRYWLNNHHSTYSPTIKVKHSLDSSELSEEQKAIISATLNILKDED